MHPFHRLSEFIEDWQSLIRKDGIVSALPTITLDISRLPYRHLNFLILTRSLAEPLPEIQQKFPFEIYQFETPHLERVRAIDRPSEARLCERRLLSGQYGLVAIHQGELAGYAWGCSPVDWELERVHLQLEPNDILCTDVYTAPALRGRGVQTALTLRRFQIFRDLGYRRAICYIEIHNAPSLAVWQRKFDAETAGKINFLRIGPWYRVRYSYRTTSQEQCDQAEKPITKKEKFIEDSG